MLHKTKALITDSRTLNSYAFSLPILDLIEHHTLNIGVQSTGQTFVRRHHDQTNFRSSSGMRTQERMLVARRRRGQMSHDITDAFSVRTSRMHAILRFAHLRCRYHFHRLSDLARILYALDLGANFLGTRHVVPLGVYRLPISRCRFS